MTELDATAQRLQALQAARAVAASQASPQADAAAPAPAAKPARTSASGPAPARIVAAAASVSAGIGLVALMAGAQQDVVVQVNPTPVMVQPASVIVELPAANGEDQPQVRVVEAAQPTERPAAQARVVTQSEGS